MTIECKWAIAALVVVSLSACNSSSEDDGAAGDAANDPAAEAGASGTGNESGAGGAGTGGADDDEDSTVVPGTGGASAGDGDGDGDGDDQGDDDSDALDCDADPHHPECIATHVRGKCDIDSGFPGDETCLLPPPPGQGIQIHIGPDDYDNPDQIAVHVFNPGNESSECFSLDTPNDEEIYFQSYVLSGRPGTHHIINTSYTTPNDPTLMGIFSLAACRDQVTDVGPRLPGAAKFYMPRQRVAPENEELGYPLGPNTPMQSDMHYFNFTDEPILREYWLNLYTVPKEKVKVTPLRIRGYGGLSFNITPGTNQVFSYSCPINEDGRIITMLGHTHAHAVRFTAWINRVAAGERQKVFETRDYNEPQVYAFNTVEVNPMFSETGPGGHTGILEVAAGDTLDWECHVINDGEATLRYTNQVYTGEMCNIWGESVGPFIDCNRL